jgi:hypothetical protein
LAIARYGLGDRDQAIALLNRAFKERDEKMVFLKVDEAWIGLEDDPGYLELLRKMNL